LLAQGTSARLLDTLKELATGRVQGAHVSREVLMERARELLEKLPTLADLQALKPAELMAKMRTDEMQELLAGVMPAPVVAMLSTLAEKVAAAAADERLAAAQGKVGASVKQNGILK
jgi:ribosomal protein L10